MYFWVSNPPHPLHKHTHTTTIIKCTIFQDRKKRKLLHQHNLWNEIIISHVVLWLFCFATKAYPKRYSILSTRTAVNSLPSVLISCCSKSPVTFRNQWDINPQKRFAIINKHNIYSIPIWTLWWQRLGFLNSHLRISKWIYILFRFWDI